MIKRCLSLVLVLVLVVGFVSFAESTITTASEKWVIVDVPKLAPTPYFDRGAMGLKEASEKYGIDAYQIGAIDFDLAIIGAVLSMTRGKTAILSNDFPLLYSYQALLVNEHLSPTKYGFFLRINSDFFSRAKHPSNS